jgi:hypothetical protein
MDFLFWCVFSKGYRARGGWVIRDIVYSHPGVFPGPMGHLKQSFFGLSQPKNEGHHVLSQLFDWQRPIYQYFYCSNGSW